jgi:hypothetical protein
MLPRMLAAIHIERCIMHGHVLSCYLTWGSIIAGMMIMMCVVGILAIVITIVVSGD